MCILSIQNIGWSIKIDIILIRVIYINMVSQEGPSQPKKRQDIQMQNSSIKIRRKTPASESLF